MFEKSGFGNASKSVSVEECLFGEELSIFAVCDGQDYKILNTAQDHKGLTIMIRAQYRRNGGLFTYTIVYKQYFISDRK